MKTNPAGQTFKQRVTEWISNYAAETRKMNLKQLRRLWKCEFAGNARVALAVPVKSTARKSRADAPKVCR